MKDNTESISDSIFTHFPSSNTRNYTRRDSYKNQISLCSNTIKKSVLAYRDQLHSGVATLGIGSVLLVTIYLFLTQLAEYGWQ